MKFFLHVTALLALWSSSALFAASLKVPMAFEYIAMDGEKISSSLIMHKSRLELSNGYHEIAIRYKDMVDNDISDTKSEVKSTAFIISLKVDGDHNYSLKPAGGDRIKDPQQFAKTPKVEIVREDHGTVDYKVTLTDITQKSFSTRLYGRNTSRQSQPTATSTTSAVATENIGASTSTYNIEPAASSAAVVSPEAGTDDAEQMLRYWWQRSDEKTRKEFLSWAIKQL